MTSRRTWLLGLTLGAAISLGTANTSVAQVPRLISYQGELRSNGQPMNQPVTITVNYYTAGGTSPIYTETFGNVQIVDGIFNLTLGSINGGGFPASMDFTEQYFIGVAINGGEELTPRTPFLSSPYALNAGAVNGFEANAIPQANGILILDGNGRVPQSALPPMQQQNVSIIGGDNITVNRDSLTNVYTISSDSKGITGVIAGEGLTGGGSNGTVTLALAPNAITTDRIANGSITGAKLAPLVAGEGLYQDVLGNLNVGVDNSSIRIINDQLTIGTIGSGSIDSSVQRRITGTTAPGSFVTGVNPDGTVTSGAITGDNSLTRTLNGGNSQFGINPANSNTFTSPQTFNGGLTTTTLNATDIFANNGTFTGTVTAQNGNFTNANIQNLNSNGTVNFGNGTSNGNVTFAPGTGTLSFSGSRLQNVGAPLMGTDAVNRDYLDSASMNQVFGGDITGTPGNITLNPTNPGAGDRFVQGVNAGTATIDDARLNDSLTVNGGSINNTPIGMNGASSGRFTTLMSSEQTMLATDMGNVVIGNDSSFANDALLEITRATADDLLVRIYNTGAGGSDLRLSGSDNTPSSISFTDDEEFISSITTDAQDGLTFNVRDPLVDPNTEAGTTAGRALTIERDGDVVIEEDLLVNGMTTFGNGTGADGFTVNPGTGTVSFSGARLENVGAPTAGTDAVNRDYVDNSTANQTFSGDITGTPGATVLNPSNTGAGDRFIQGVNAGTTTIDDDRVNDSLTVNGGSINNTPIGATGASTGNFTTLTSSDQTNLANTTGNVLIGTATSFANDALLEVSRASATPLLSRFFNTGAGGSEIRLTGATAQPNIVSFTDMAEYVSSISSDGDTGMMFNVRDLTDPNTEAGLAGATAMTIERDGDVVIEEDLLVKGMATFGDGTGADGFTVNPGTGTVSFSGARLENVGAPTAGTDAVNRDYVDNSTANQTFSGDITGTPGATVLNPSNTGAGDRFIQGVNAGTTTIDDDRVNDSLTVNGGSINNTPIGATGASTGNFTTLTSSDQTNLANTTGNVLIGTATSFANDALLEVSRATADDLLVRVFNTGAGGTDLRLTGQTAQPNMISFTDQAEFVSSIVSDGDQGLLFNVRDLTDPNTEAGLAGANAMTIERDGDVVIQEDLTVNGDANFGNGDDDVMFNSGTGTIDFGGSRLQDVGAPTAGTDAVNRDYVDNAAATQPFAGDITGTPGANTFDPNNPGAGDRVIDGINNGTTTIDDARVNDAQTIDGGTVNNTPIGATGASSGTFTTLTSTGETMLSTTNGNVVIGTPVNTDFAQLEVVENMTSGVEAVGAYIRSTATGTGTRALGLVAEATSDGTADATRPVANAVLGVAKYNGALNTTEQLMGVVGKAEPGTAGITSIGVVGQATDANTLSNTGVLGIARSGGTLGGTSNVGVIGAAGATDAQLEGIAATFPDAGVYGYNPTTDGAAVVANAPAATGTAIEVLAGDLSATAPATLGVSNRFADTYVVPTGGTTIVVPNSLVTTTSTVIVTYENNGVAATPSYNVQTDSAGQFTVVFETPVNAGDEIHYIIINH